MKTLQEILFNENKRRHEDGPYGISACKEAIRFDIEFTNKTLYELLGEYVRRANESVFFNDAMVLACWEIINEKGESNGQE